MTQTNIYHFLGLDDDPLFKKIKSLKKGETIEVDGILIKRNHFDYYEMETDHAHEHAPDLINIYKKICEVI